MRLSFVAVALCVAGPAVAAFGSYVLSPNDSRLTGHALTRVLLSFLSNAKFSRLVGRSGLEPRDVRRPPVHSLIFIYPGLKAALGCDAGFNQTPDLQSWRVLRWRGMLDMSRWYL